MNKARRQRISECITILEKCQETLEDILSDEDEARDNMPESMIDSERYAASEECSDELNDALDSIASAVDSLQNI